MRKLTKIAAVAGLVAVLLAATLDHRRFKDVSAITFGQPKFTDAHGAAKLAHLKILRIVHDEDPVPMLPPLFAAGDDFASYQHFEPEVILDASGHYYYQPEHDSGRLDVAKHRAEIKTLKPMSHVRVKGDLLAWKLALEGASKSKDWPRITPRGRVWGCRAGGVGSPPRWRWHCPDRL